MVHNIMSWVSSTEVGLKLLRTRSRVVYVQKSLHMQKTSTEYRGRILSVPGLQVAFRSLQGAA
jgi:hypothetical protein